MCLRTGNRKRKVYFKSEDRKRILLSKVGTGKEFWSENWDRKRIVISKQGTGKNILGPNSEIQILFRSLLLRVKFFSGPYFSDHFSFPVPSSEIHFSFPVPNSETHTISRIFGKCLISLYCGSFWGNKLWHGDQWPSLSNILKDSFWWQGPFNTCVCSRPFLRRTTNSQVTESSIS